MLVPSPTRPLPLDVLLLVKKGRGEEGKRAILVAGNLKLYRWRLPLMETTEAADEAMERGEIGTIRLVWHLDSQGFYLNRRYRNCVP